MGRPQHPCAKGERQPHAVTPQRLQQERLLQEHEQSLLLSQQQLLPQPQNEAPPDQAASSGQWGGGTLQYLISPPPNLAEEEQPYYHHNCQHQHLQGPSVTPLSVSSHDASRETTPFGTRGWLVELRLAATTGLATLKHKLSESPLSRLLVVVLVLSVLCFVLLRTNARPLDASASLSAAAETHGGLCSTDYRDKTLKLAHEASAFSLLAEGWPLSKFEASDVVVCDSTFSLMKTGFGLEPLSPENELIGLPERNGSLESDWEALWVDDVVRTPPLHLRLLSRFRDADEDVCTCMLQTGVFYVVREAITHNFDEEDREEALETEQPEQPKAQSQKRKGRKKPFHAHIEELTLHGNTYTLEATCTTEFSFSAGNKGLEGLVGFRGPKGEIYLLGNGRMVLMQKETDGQKCTWKTLKVLELPSEISFPDYSAVTTRGNRIAIASQEGSTLWIGKINQEEVTDDKGQRSVVLSSPEELEVLPGGRVLHFPRDESCEIMYCNIEGIAFINDRLIAAASDKAKRWQDHRCVEKDQSLHVFSLPHGI
ncbi:hypothetical protein cyc_03293 [Cyclospora cayetanensis]|uniref:Uncharacterized protein n=1 Tax=Cyclospora cayetanensis TaxID=88456 RepID=A0A1D3D8A1_9EIME|nr:hypothetical protein cyc_03293 [Cyclospora cayetanensis]